MKGLGDKVLLLLSHYSSNATINHATEHTGTHTRLQVLILIAMMMTRGTLSWRSANQKVLAVRRPPVNPAIVSLTRYYDYDDLAHELDLNPDLTPELNLNPDLTHKLNLNPLEVCC